MRRWLKFMVLASVFLMMITAPSPQSSSQILDSPISQTLDYTPTHFYFQIWNQKVSRGSSYIENEMFGFTMSSPTYPGNYYIETRGLSCVNFSQTMYDINSGYLTSVFDTQYNMSVFPKQTTHLIGNNDGNGTSIRLNYISSYLCSNLSDIYADRFTGFSLYLTVNLANNTDTTTIFIPAFLDFWILGYHFYEEANILMQYELLPILSLNSTFYNTKNTNLYVYTLLTPSINYSSAYGDIYNLPGDPPVFGWVQQEYDSMCLYHPNYKLRITDLNENIIFEDAEMQNFTRFRTIDLNAIKLQNNSPEPIVMDVVQNSTYIAPSGEYTATYPFDDFNELTDWSYTSDGLSRNVSIIEELDGHNGVVEIIDMNTIVTGGIKQTFSSHSTGTMEFWLYSKNTTYRSMLDLECSYLAIAGNTPGKWQYNDGSWHVLPNASDPLDNTWYHIQATWDIAANQIEYWVNGVSSGPLALKSAVNVSSVEIKTASDNPSNIYLYIDALDYSWSEGYYLHRNMDLPTDEAYFWANAEASAFTHNLSRQVNSYEFSLSNWTAGLSYYRISDVYNNTIEYGSIDENDTSISYTAANVRECFLSLANQQNTYLAWENYRIYLNTSQIYSNRFYREINTDVNISIYSRFGAYLTSYLHTVTRDDNWIPINLTQYALKIYNQQAQFIHYNITLDPAYYPGSTVFWSEWLAPGEIGKNLLYPDHYIVSLFANESGTPSYVSYAVNFDDDDILLISSANTIFAVLQNIENLGSDVESQFTYVTLNFTNTNNRIGNMTTIITIEFNGENVTLEDFFLAQINEIGFVNSNLSNFIQYYNNNWTFWNANLTGIYSFTEDSYTFLTSTVDSFITSSTITINAIESAIGSLDALLINNFLAINSTFEDLNTYLLANFTMIDAAINSSTIVLSAEIGWVNSNITNASVTMLNRLNLVNSSISDLIANLSSAILIYNDTIYNAILDVSTNLAIDSNNILGNLSITYAQNEFLTELFKRTMFSELLNWTGAGYNYSLIENQIEQISFVNAYRNESIELILKYQNEIETKQLAALESLSLFLPGSNVEFRIRSIATGEYLSDWDDIDSQNITLGFYDEIIPATPEQVQLEIKDYLLVALFGSVAFAVVTVLYLVTKADLEAVPLNKRKPAPRVPGVRDSTSLFFGDIDRPRSRLQLKDAQRRSVITVGSMIVLSFMTVYLLVRFGV